MYKCLGNDALVSPVRNDESHQRRTINPSKSKPQQCVHTIQGKRIEARSCQSKGHFQSANRTQHSDCLIYIDEDDQLGVKMSHFQVDNENGRNIRDHILW